MSSDDSQDASPRAPPNLRRKAQAREALLDFAETTGKLGDRTQAAFAMARGAQARANSRKIGLLHFAAHVLLLVVGLVSAAVGLLCFSLGSWFSGTVGARLFSLEAASDPTLFYLCTLVSALLGTGLLFVAVYLLSRLGAPSAELSRFARALPKAFRPARPALLIAIWLVCAGVVLGWSLGGT